MFELRGIHNTCISIIIRSGQRGLTSSYVNTTLSRREIAIIYPFHYKQDLNIT